jgi:hypothetical protein
MRHWVAMARSCPRPLQTSVIRDSPTCWVNCSGVASRSAFPLGGPKVITILVQDGREQAEANVYNYIPRPSARYHLSTCLVRVAQYPSIKGRATKEAPFWGWTTPNTIPQLIEPRRRVLHSRNHDFVVGHGVGRGLRVILLTAAHPSAEISNHLSLACHPRLRGNSVT